MQASPSPSDSGASPRRLGASLLGLLQGHVALFAEELSEQRAQALRVTLLAGLCLVFTLLMLIAGSAVLLILFWDSYRLQAGLALCALYGLGLLLCVLRLKGTLRQASPPFSASLEELARDREQLLP